MKKKYTHLNTLAAIAGLALTATSANAALLSVDFGSAGAEAGFVEQSSASVLHSTTGGDLTVAVTDTQGGTFDRGVGAGATHGTNTDMYRDFFFDNSNNITITLSGAAISANTDYIMTFYAYDEAENRNTSFIATGDTTGATLGPVNAPADSDITSLGQFAVTGTFNSGASGVLTFNAAGPSRAVINGLEISAVPEPSTTALLGLGGLALILRRRK